MTVSFKGYYPNYQPYRKNLSSKKSPEFERMRKAQQLTEKIDDDKENIKDGATTVAGTIGLAALIESGAAVLSGAMGFIGSAFMDKEFNTDLCLIGPLVVAPVVVLFGMMAIVPAIGKSVGSSVKMLYHKAKLGLMSNKMSNIYSAQKGQLTIGEAIKDLRKEAPKIVRL